MMASNRNIVGEIGDRDQLRRLMRYRDHASVELVGELPNLPDYEKEGAACAAAWLHRQPQDAVTLRLRLALPADLEPSSEERAALVSRVLADAEFGGG